jgi:hypothetical protein
MLRRGRGERWSVEGESKVLYDGRRFRIGDHTGLKWQRKETHYVIHL